MGRAPCCDKANVKKGPWSPEEDAKLKEYIEKSGTGGNWIALPHKAGKPTYEFPCNYNTSICYGLPAVGWHNYDQGLEDAERVAD